MLTADGYRVTALKHAADLATATEGTRTWHLLVASLSPEFERFARRTQESSPQLRLLCIARCEESRHSVDWLPAAHQSALRKPYALSELLRAARKLLDA
jgi:DNA-binding response OmpR family regulator